MSPSILARARAKHPNAGYAADFVAAAMAPNLEQIAREGVKVISKASGANFSVTGLIVPVPEPGTLLLLGGGCLGIGLAGRRRR